MNSIHLLHECSVTKLWECKLGFRDLCLERRRECFKELKPQNKHKMNAMWIMNWCIWKTYNKVRFDELNKEDAHYFLRETIKFEEHRFLLMHQKIPKDYEKIPEIYLHILSEHLKYRKIDHNHKITRKN